MVGSCVERGTQRTDATVLTLCALSVLTLTYCASRTAAADPDQTIHRRAGPTWPGPALSAG
jgi:hypothetical protein